MNSDVIYDMKNKQGLSYGSINFAMNAITLFFEINDVSINRKKISRFKGENTSKFEYRSYTVDEISLLLSTLDKRGKAIVLLMCSTGMRVGALPDIRLKHLKKWVIDNPGTHVYQVTVYANFPKSKYKTFCTPECAKATDHYLEFRQRHGDRIKYDSQSGSWIFSNNNTTSDSYPFVKNFNKQTQGMLKLDQRMLFSTPIVTKSFNYTIVTTLEQSGLSNKLRLL